MPHQLAGMVSTVPSVGSLPSRMVERSTQLCWPWKCSVLVPLTSFSSTNFRPTLLRVIRSKNSYLPSCVVPAGKRYCRPLRSAIFTAGVLSPGE